MEAYTLNDWVGGLPGREVSGGDVVEIESVKVLVRKIRRKKVQEAQVIPFTARENAKSGRGRPTTSRQASPIKGIHGKSPPRTSPI
jgi:hypothetical protein